MQQLEATIILIGIDDKLVVDRQDLGRGILPDCMNCDLEATQLELQQWRDPFNAFDNASCQSGEQQLGGVERIRSPRKCRIKRDFRILVAATLPAASVRRALTR